MTPPAVGQVRRHRSGALWKVIGISGGWCSMQPLFLGMPLGSSKVVRKSNNVEQNWPEVVSEEAAQ